MPTALDAAAPVWAIWTRPIPIIVLTGLNDEHFGVSAVSSRCTGLPGRGPCRPGDAAPGAVLYAIERKRAELTAVDLHASRLRAMENARLERGLLPSPLLLEESRACDIFTQCPPEPAARPWSARTSSGCRARDPRPDRARDDR